MVARSDVQPASRPSGCLRDRRLSLAARHQDDIDQWLTSPEPGRYLTRNFLAKCSLRGGIRHFLNSP